MDCIFCKIIAGTIPATVVTQTEHIIVIKDIFPKAPVHYLIIPKKHIIDLRALTPADALLTHELLFMPQQLAKTLSEPQDFRLSSSNGYQAGQRVFHLHIHFLAGKTFTDL